MDVVTNITLDFAKQTFPVVVFAKQYDYNSRKISITPLNNGLSYAIPDGVTARIQATKPDGKTVINDCTIENGKIIAKMTAQLLTVDGRVKAEIGLYQDDYCLSTQIFYICVEESAYDAFAVESSDEYGFIEGALEKAKEALEIAEDALEKAENAGGGTGGGSGQDGVGISSAVIDEDGELIIYLTDGKILNVGKVVGEDGQDGVSVVGASIVGGLLNLTLSNGETIVAGSVVGEKGDMGVGIVDVNQSVTSTEDDGINIISIFTSDDKSYNFEVKNGSKGGKGDKGDTGATGEKGDKGDKGEPGTNGTNGKDGKDGVSVTHSWSGTELTITSASGTTTVNLQGPEGKQGQAGKDGADGATGQNGKDGTSVTVSKVTESTADGGSNVVTFSDGKTLTVKNGGKGSPGKDGTNGTNGTNGKDGKTPVKGTDYFTPADKAEMVAEVTASLDGIPDYWKTALEEGAEEINTALCKAGSNKSAFLFYTDTHWNYGSQMSHKLLKYLYRHTGMTKTNFGGDIVNDEGTGYDTMEYLWQWREMLKDLPNHHSVVGNHDDGNSTNNLFSEQYVYGYLLAPEETENLVRGDSGLYYYIDNGAEKTRYLYLDSAYQGMVAKQQDFIKEALLSTPEGWHIVAVSHIWYDTNYNTSPPSVGELNSGASIALAMFDNYNSRTGDYADCGGWVEFCIGGHTHLDFDGTSATGIPILLVETDSKHVRSGLSYTAGTTTEASVNGIIADYANRKIHVVRIGRGESREVAITNYVVSYTNLIPLSTTNDGVTIYNESESPGYKANTRWSSSSNVDQASSGIYITGYIPINPKDTVYFKNITFPNVSSGNNGIIHMFKTLTDTAEGNINGSSLTSSYSAVWGTDGNLKQITFASNTTYKYIRVQCAYIGADSVITINEPIE